jgi:hypothetical protein
MTVFTSANSPASKGDDEERNPSVTRPGRLRRAVTVITMLLMLAAGSVATAVPASAATGATATVCFKHNTGGPYTYTVLAQTYTYGQWRTLGSFRGSVNGCSTWTLPAGQYIKFQAFYRVGTAYFMGNSGWVRTISGTHYNYFTHNVYMYKY